MKTKGQSLSPIRQIEIRDYEKASRPVVGLAVDYPSRWKADFHSHPRIQLLYTVSGIMNVESETASYIIPPSTALIMPANIDHSICMNGPVEMKTLFIKKLSASRNFDTPRVIAVAALLRELILAVCNEPLNWEFNGRGHLIIKLALSEISRSTVLSIDLPMPLDLRIRSVVEFIRLQPHSQKSMGEWAEIATTSERTMGRLFRSETGLSFSQWRQQARLIAAMSSLTTGSTLKPETKFGSFYET